MDIKINGREIGEHNPTYIIAELSANHNNDLDLTFKTLDAMKEAGADAVKLQTYTADTITFNSDSEMFRTKPGTLGNGRTFYELYEEAHLPWEWHKPIFNYAKEIGLDCFSSPFDFTAVDLLEDLGTPAYKIASLEIVDIPLIQKVARTGKPIILSTGIATEEDIELAINTCRAEGNDQIALLKCTSAYPTPLDEVNLNMMKEFKRKFDVVLGLSDHTMDVLVPVASVVLGGRIIEKHFILDRSLGGVDSSFSLNKDEFSQMVKSVRDTETLLGNEKITLTNKMESARKNARSLFVTTDVQAGDLVTPENVRSIRPGVGLQPRYYEEILGKHFNQDVSAGTPLSLDLITND